MQEIFLQMSSRPALNTAVRAAEVHGLGQLAGEAVGGVAARIEEMHSGVAGRAFEAAGVMAAPVRAIHDLVARGVYQGVRAALEATVRASAAQAVPRDTHPIDERLAGRLAVGVLNGAFGDLLERERNALAVHMSIRRHGETVSATAPALRAAFPDATPKLVVFLHGLCGTEDAWWFWARRHVPYGARLQAELGCTPVYVRYNSGRHISENGRELASLLDQVARAWPLEVEEIALIGHSMGGLVVRSGCHYGADMEWAQRVRHVFMLGTPHRGAPLEQLACAASTRLGALPETRALQSALNLRSAGIKDLCHGFLCDEDWIDQDADAFLHSQARQIPFLTGANHYFVAATLSRDPNAPVGRLMGDLLVRHASAWGCDSRRERLTFPIDNYWHFGPAHHLSLMNHPAVYAQLRRWLARPALPAVSLLAQD
jgi:pimeloyl-ACP methyl ester carboxylesterase